MQQANAAFTDTTFEDEVRRIARHLWPAAAFFGSAKEAGQERDGIFITDEMVHLIECTVSRRKDKAQKDASKLATLSKTMSAVHPTKGVKGYFITLEEPTAEQRQIVNTMGGGYVVCLSYSQFRSQMIDAQSYLVSRMDYPFGSMFDPETQSRVEASQLIPPEFGTERGEVYGLSDIVRRLDNGETLLLMGDYGTGKSTTLREVFAELRSLYFSKKIVRFPVHINLRDHNGQTNPAEALERHARNIGFGSPSHLVKAWRAGFVTLILDGFDEFALIGWSGQAKRLRDLRYNSMELIRQFLRGSPSTGILIAGRQHYFDSDTELLKALDLRHGYLRLELRDFTDEQVQAFLQKRGWQSGIPGWLPSRPLLLGYLSARGMLKEVMSIERDSTPAAGWDTLLELISNREAEIEAGIDGTAVRRIIETLASKVRSRSDGIGSLSREEILSAFSKVCGFEPDDRGMVLLQRLPGLGATKDENGDRDFIDADFADAARSGDVVRFIEDPFSFQIENLTTWQATLNQLGIELAARRCQVSHFNEGKVRTALQQSSKEHEYDVLRMDLIQVSKEMGFGGSNLPIRISGIVIRDASFGEAGLDFSLVAFRDCLFQRLEIDAFSDDSVLPKFYECYVGVLDGRVSQSDLPKGVFDGDCTFDSFGESSQNTAAILRLPLSTGAKVLLTILKKLYLQPGAGRRQSALFRGLDNRARILVPEVLELLVKEGLTVRSTLGEEAVWLPIRSEAARVHRLLSSPMGSNDTLLQQANSIS